mmetsp:Transcript_66823/g.159921  ORF Transcript_66823/g.159921 Transcript_66823/m.159921 type:complete len:753 (-) Transcript_66823:53-2311(-)
MDANTNPMAQAALAEGQRCLQIGRFEDAIVKFSQAVQLAPQNPLVYAHLGDAHAQLGHFEDVVASYRRALALKPDWIEVRTSLAQTYKCHSRPDEAIAIGREALAMAPTDCKALETLVSAMVGVCEWEGITKLFADFTEAIRAEIASGRVPCNVHPWNAATYPLDADVALGICRSHAAYTSAMAASLNCPPLEHPAPEALEEGERLKIGYISSEFCDHPLAHLMGSVFGLHDRTNFEVYVYALKPGDGTSWALRVEQSADHYKDVSAMTSPEIAQLISDDGIHIAVNLNGWTKCHRNEVFALRPAPIHVQFLGYPATTGADWIDYAIADPVAAPPHTHKAYSEAMALMPHSFICTDHKQVHMDLLNAPPPARAEVGLPDAGIVFACMNQLFKIEPWLFDVWCRILRRVPGSVLWLLKSPPTAEPRLKREAQKRGIDPGRIIFADRAVKSEYIRRMKLVDLFLDTPLYNSFTTGADALWAGCPMITMPLERMASRAAASECSATGLGAEMIVQSAQEYEERAVELAMDPGKLNSLKWRLQQARLTCPLYDTHMWVRDVERAFSHMWDLYAEGEEPRSFGLKPLPPPTEAERKPAAPIPRAPSQAVPGQPVRPQPKAAQPKAPPQPLQPQQQLVSRPLAAPTSARLQAVQHPADIRSSQPQHLAPAPFPHQIGFPQKVQTVVAGPPLPAGKPILSPPKVSYTGPSVGAAPQQVQRHMPVMVAPGTVPATQVVRPLSSAPMAIAQAGAARLVQRP